MTIPKLPIICIGLALGTLFLFAVTAVAQVNPVTITMRDACDPATFNTQVGPGTCVAGEHGTTPFDLFIGELTSDRIAGAWRFNPLLKASSGTFELMNLNLTAGQQTVLQNKGGETHTFTRVKKFGGGFVPALNTLSGNPIPAPECLQAPSDKSIFVAAGETETGPTAGTPALPEEISNWQCCIHPWMRIRIGVDQGQDQNQE